MSHHLDTPLAAQTGQLYIDDLYVFPGEGSTVFVMDVNSNITGVHSEPGFHPEARYEFKVHFDGADFEALTYRVAFGEAGADGQPGPPAARPHRRRRHARTPRPATWSWRAGPARRRARAAPGCGPGASRTRSTSTCRCWPWSTARWPGGPRPDLSGWRPEGAQNSFAGTHRRLDRAGGLPPHPLLRPGARAGVWCRHQAGHRRGRLAADQPGRAPDDVADLLAGRHRLLRPGQHPAPVRGRRRRGQVHRRAGRRRGSGRRDLR